MRNNNNGVKLLPDAELALCDWNNVAVGEVITASEACQMWGLSKTAVKMAALTRRVGARKSFTGGEWLISLASMIEVYGKPKEDTLTWLKSK